ncbi:MAG: PQQ-binding-like beta-propeller repeat protein [Ignavibacteriae bacterium]|nr:PQQ-binding-like beta-propeller repeat protein [Ignavibacteriota bacterium]
MKILTSILTSLLLFNTIYSQTPGTIKWEFQTRGNEITSPAIDEDGTIYFGSSDSSLYALNSDGSKKWEFKTGGSITSSPTIGENGTIYFGSHDHKVYAINPDGIVNWEYETGGKIYYSPAIGEDETIYIKSYDKYFYAFNSDGSIKWTYLHNDSTTENFKWLFSSAIIDESGLIFLYLQASRKFIGLNSDGNINDNVLSNVDILFRGIIDNDSCYYRSLADGDGEGDYYWFASDDKDWKNRWSNDSYLYFPIMGNDETIYTIKRNSKLLALNFDGEVKWDADISLYDCAPLAMDRKGNLLVPQSGGKLTLISTTSTGLADSPWPKFNKDYKNTARAEKFPNAIVAENFISKKDPGIITLDASLSNDKEGLQLSFLWSVIKQPEGSSIVLTDSTSPKIEVNIPSFRGEFFFKVKVINSKEKYSTNVVHVSTLHKRQLSWDKNYSAIGLDSTIYYFDDSKYYAINPDGTTKWEFSLFDPYYFNPTNISGASIGNDGTIYFGTSADYLYAINPSGIEKWKFKTDGGFRNAPAIGSDGTLYFGTWARKFYALNSDGTKKWEYETEHHIESSPSIENDGTIYIGCNNLYAFNPDGSIKWKTSIGGFFGSSPAIDIDGTIYMGSGDHNMYSINPDGTIKWKFLADDGIYSSAVIGVDGSLYFGTQGGTFFALNPDGTKKWEFDANSTIYSSPIIGNDGTIFFGTYDSGGEVKFFAFNSDGKKKWEYNFNFGRQFNSAIGNDGTIYFGNYALYSDCTGLADTPWPKSSKNNQNTSISTLNPLAPQAFVSQNNFSMKYGTIILDGSPSYDPDGDNLNFKWSIFKKPKGCIVNIKDSTSAITEVTIPKIPGIFIFVLKVTDDNDGTSYTSVTVNNENKWEFSLPYESRFSPAIDSEGNIYVSANQILYSIKPDGTLKWELDIGSEIRCPPIIDQDGWIYITTSDWKLQVINPSGIKIWEFKDVNNHPPAIGFTTINSLENEKVIYIASAPWNYEMYALNKSGDIIWTFQAGGECYSPSIGEDGSIYFGSRDKNIYALNPDGSEKWKYYTEEQFEAPFTSPAIDKDGSIYLTYYHGTFYALDSNGTLKWKYDNESSVFYESSPIIGNDGTLYIMSNNGILIALNQDGTKKFGFDTDFYSGYFTPTIGKNGNIYINSLGFCMLNPNGELIYKFDLPNNRYSSPTINNDGTIYTISGNSLYALETECKGLADSLWSKIGGNKFNSGMSHYIIPGFSVDSLSGNIPFTVQFSDTSYGNVFNRHWDFGDGQTSTEKNPVHTYAYPDSFTVMLIISNPSKSDTLTKENYIVALNSTGIAGNTDLPKEYKLYENYPNPFNPETNIEFDVKEATKVKLKVYNITGQLITTIVDKTMERGHYKYQFNGSNLSSGIYFYRIDMGNYTSIKKMILIK